MPFPLVVSRVRYAILIAAAALALAACGGDEQDESGPAETIRVPAASETESVREGAPDRDSDDDDGPADGRTDGGVPVAASEDVADLPQRPQPDHCVDVPVPDDGLYTVYEAGTAVVRQEGNHLVLGEARASDGWNARVDDEEPEEVEIDFRRGDSEVLDLEVELDDGRVEAKVCADDD